MISSVIVLFNPDLSHLNFLINSLENQVDHIILVDNTPLNLKKYRCNEFDDFKKVHYIDLMDNLGIAKAHNEGIKKSKDLNSEYVIIFDQDSSVEKDFIEKLYTVNLKIRRENKNVCAVGPTYVDIKTNTIAPVIRYRGFRVQKIFPNPNEHYTKADHIISSGTLIKIEDLEKIGPMFEELFIDYVDLEWGLRAKKMGYDCYIANNVIMKHSIGDSSLKVPFSKKFLNIHSDFRKYFIIRNALYLSFYSDLQINWRILQIPKTINYFIFMFLFVSPRINIIKIFFKALKDALFKNMGRGSI